MDKADTPVSSGGGDRTIPLQVYRWALRKPWIAVDADQLVLRLPVYFGSRLWRIPVSEVAVADTESLEQSATLAGVHDDVVFADGIDIPYFFTTGPATEPTLLLQFRHPQRVPPLSAISAMAPNVDLSFGYFSSRSAEGATVDGVLLRVPDAPAAALQLVDAGAERLVDPAGWLQEHREVVTDPVEREEVVAREGRAVWTNRAGNALLIGALIGLALLGRGDPDADLPTFWLVFWIGLMVVGLLVRWQARRLLKRG